MASTVDRPIQRIVFTPNVPYNIVIWAVFQGKGRSFIPSGILLIFLESALFSGKAMEKTG